MEDFTSEGKCHLLVRNEFGKFSHITLSIYFEGLDAELTNLKTLSKEEAQKIFSDEIDLEIFGDKTMFASDLRMDDVHLMVYEFFIDDAVLMLHPDKDMRALGKIYHEYKNKN